MKTRAAPIALALGLCACNPWPSFEQAPRLPDDPRLGTLVLEVGQLQSTYITAYAKGPDLWVGVLAGAGLDENFSPAPASDRLLRLDPQTLAAQEELDPPGGATAPLSFGLALNPDHLVIARGGESPIAAVRAAGSWEKSDLPADADLGQDVIVALAPGRLALQRGVSEVRVDTGAGVWPALDLPADALDRAIVAWAREGMTVVWTTQTGDLCAGTWSPPETAPASDATCAGIGDAAGLPGPTVNGTAARFQVAIRTTGGTSDTLRLYVMEGGRWVEGDQVEGDGLLSQPGSDRALLRREDPSITVYGGYAAPSLWAVEGGEVIEQALTASPLNLDCGCTRADDPECGCYARALVGLLATDGQGQSATLVTLSDADGRRTVSARRLTLPFEGDPLGGGE